MSDIMERIRQGKFVLIAEIGVNYYDIAKKNHISNLEAAKLMVKKAKEAGIHGVKFQSYKAETLAVKESPAYWDMSEESTSSQYELFQKFDSFGEREYRELAEYCGKQGIEFLSTAFDVESTDYLEELVEIYKISSSDLNNLPFVEYQARKGKPMILSAGASNAEEIDRAITAVRKYNQEPIVLMHCVLEYPTPYEHANLNKIVSLKERYPDLIIGYSDHTKPDVHSDIIKTAYYLGAQVVEKHFTLDKNLPGNDHYHAMDPKDAEQILKGIAFMEEIRGGYELECLESEQKARKNARRSLISAEKIKRGTRIEKSMLTWKRPGTGISPEDMEKLVGKKAKEDILEDTILQWNMFVV